MCRDVGKYFARVSPVCQNQLNGRHKESSIKEVKIDTPLPHVGILTLIYLTSTFLYLATYSDIFYGWSLWCNCLLFLFWNIVVMIDFCFIAFAKTQRNQMLIVFSKIKLYHNTKIPFKSRVHTFSLIFVQSINLSKVLSIKIWRQHQRLVQFSVPFFIWNWLLPKNGIKNAN